MTDGPAGGEPQYTTRVEGDTFIMEFVAPKQLKLHPEYEAMVWDQCLRMAHEQMLMPVGPIAVTEEDFTESKPPEALAEGETLEAKLATFVDSGKFAAGVRAGFFGEPKVDMMKVRAEVMVGVSLA